MKACSKCNVEKQDDEFYPNTRKCKECTKASVRENYRNNRERYSAYEKLRNTTHDRREWKRQYQPIAKQRNSLKVKARCTVANALRDGKLTRKPCEVCGSSNVEAHHDDYSKPLEVRWLCYTHHCEVHGKQSVA